MLTGWRYKTILLCLSLLFVAGLATAQVQRRGGQRAVGPRARTNQQDREAMQQRVMQQLRQQLEATESQWQVIEPKLQKVMDLSRQVGQGRRGAMQGRLAARSAPGQRRQGANGQNRPARDNANRPTSAVQKASDELDTLLSNSNASPEQIQAKLATLRTVREAAEKDLTQARDALKQELTVKQEARLVLMGLLE